MKTLLVSALAVLLSTSLTAQVTHYWVDATNGKDTNAGTKAAPFKTLEKGLLISKLDAVIHIMPGTYGPNSTGDFWDTTQTPPVEKDIVLRDYQNVKILGEDRDTCIIDFNGKGSKFWGFISVRGAATDGLEIANLTFQNIVPTVWGSHWGCGAVIINGGAGKTNIHGCHYIDANAAWINWGAGTDNAFHHNVVRRTVPNTHANAVRIRHDAGKKTYIYNNTFINQDIGIGLSGGTKKDGQVVCNNLIIDSGTGMAGDGPGSSAATGSLLENNNCFNNTTNYTTVWPKSNISVDPQLVDVAKGDFRLKATSPMVDAGHPAFMQYQVNEYYYGAACVDMNKDARSEPDIGCHELALVSLTIPTPWVQGGTPTINFNRTDPTYALGFFGLSLLPSGTPSFPAYKADPFGTLGLNMNVLLYVKLLALPTAPNFNPLGTNIPTLPALNDLSLYAQGFAYATTPGGDRFQPTGVRTITL